MRNQVTDARVRRVSFVERAATRDPQNPTQPRRKLLWKSEDAPDDPALPGKGGSDMTPEEMKVALEKAEKERDEALAKADAAEKEKAELEKRAIGKKTTKPADGDPVEDEDPDDLSKADLPDAVKAHLAKADAEVAELRKRAESAEEIAKAERDERLTREFISKAERELPHMGASDVVGGRLKRLSETLTKAEYDEFYREQVAVNEQLQKGAVFAEYGTSGPGAPAASPGLPEVMKKAEELQKADSNLSSAEAFRRAMRDPAVAAQYAKERAGV